MRSEHRYALGHDAFEIERLQLQSTVIGSVTRRLIEQSGIRPGMHVLDIGCGVGDVSMLLAEASARRAAWWHLTASRALSRLPGRGLWPLDIDASNLWWLPTSRFPSRPISTPRSGATSLPIWPIPLP